MAGRLEAPAVSRRAILLLSSLLHRRLPKGYIYKNMHKEKASHMLKALFRVEVGKATCFRVFLHTSLSPHNTTKRIIETALSIIMGFPEVLREESVI